MTTHPLFLSLLLLPLPPSLHPILLLTSMVSIYALSPLPSCFSSPPSLASPSSSSSLPFSISSILFLHPFIPGASSHFSFPSILYPSSSSFVCVSPPSLSPLFFLHHCPLSAGGLLSERYLGKAEPNSRAELYTASLSKYKNMIDSWGGWSLFQDLLVALETAARRHDCSVASVATRYVLDRPAVGGVIVGCRLGVAGAGQHISDSLRSCSPDLKLTGEDLAAIKAVIQRSRDLTVLIGDCGDEYRS